MADSNDSIIVYHNAWNEYEGARVAVAHMGEILARFAEALGKWPDQVQFYGLTKGLPAEVSASPNPITLNPDELRTADAIWEMLLKYHDARRRTHAAWEALSAADKRALRPPQADPPRR